MEIKIKISDHPWRCIDTDGVMCQFLRTFKFGQVWVCAIFSEGNDPLDEREGCLEKHPECIALQDAV